MIGRAEILLVLVRVREGSDSGFEGEREPCMRGGPGDEGNETSTVVYWRLHGFLNGGLTHKTVLLCKVLCESSPA